MQDRNLVNVNLTKGDEDQLYRLRHDSVIVAGPS